MLPDQHLVNNPDIETNPATSNPPPAAPPVEMLYQAGYRYPGMVRPRPAPRPPMVLPPFKPSLRIVIIALGLGWSGDILFNGQLVGLNGLLFVGLLLTALFGTGWLEKVRPSFQNLWIVLPLMFFCAMLMIRANGMLTFLNGLSIIFLLSLLVYFYAGDQLQRLSLLGYPVVLLDTIGQVLVRPVPVVAAVTKGATSSKNGLRRALPLLRGVGLALPLLAIFTFLLSSADKIFAGYTDQVFKIEFLKHLPQFFNHLVVIGLLGYLVAGGLVYACRRTVSKQATENLPGTIVPRRVVGFTEAVTILVLVDLLFVVFAWIQVTFLFSGEAQRTMDYQAYRDYVRRGFGELLFASFLTMILILGLRWLSRHERIWQERVFKVLCCLMIGLAMIMIVSAYQRMITWENVENYINTPVRMYVRSFIIWLSVGFGWLFCTMWFLRNRFAVGAFVAVMGFLITVNLLNPDADSAEYNLSRYQNVQYDDLGTRYLPLISEDGVPAMAAALDQTSGLVYTRLRNQLTMRYVQMSTGRQWQQWPAFHFSRWRAYEVLHQLYRAGKLNPDLILEATKFQKP